MEGIRHDWTLYVCSNIKNQLENVCFVDGDKYYVHVDCGYKLRSVVDVPFQGEKLSAAASSANYHLNSVRVTAE